MPETPSAVRAPVPAAVPAPPDALDTDLGWTLGVVFRAYVKFANAVFRDLPGGPRGYQVLAAAAQELPGGQGALAQRLGIDKTVMTYLVDDLENAGLVQRRPDPADRRNKRIVATERGRTTWEATQVGLDHAEEHILSPLDPADRVEFRELLRRLAVRAQSLDPVADTCQIVTDLATGEPAAPTPPRPRRAARR
ncbi:MarR family winged helix-turn-helix transcriptional regulator [Sphaerisporangium sp. NPDC049002]|uniref:MarR family winged helix-turn-helix transcriptional regulator n=1 Tax=Sphaerisporangium sp. NPDC049002 TaxID=3155392 RepID=UPI0033F08A5D